VQRRWNLKIKCDRHRRNLEGIWRGVRQALSVGRTDRFLHRRRPPAQGSPFHPFPSPPGASRRLGAVHGHAADAVPAAGVLHHRAPGAGRRGPPRPRPGPPSGDPPPRGTPPPPSPSRDPPTGPRLPTSSPPDGRGEEAFPFFPTSGYPPRSSSAAFRQGASQQLTVSGPLLDISRVDMTFESDKGSIRGGGQPAAYPPPASSLSTPEV